MEIKLNNICSKNLTNINTLFNKNQITSLIGSNESMRTELLNLIIGLEKIISGNIEYKIQENNSNLNNKEINENIYYMKEDNKDMLFNINIKEDIKFYLGKYNDEKLNELLKSFDLELKILDSNYLELSSSEKIKILLIIGLMSSKEIIILDNPTSTLDTKSIQTLIKYLKKLKRQNKIIIISSYNTNFLLEISDKIIVLDNKKIIAEGNKFDILSNEKLLNKINIDIPNVIKVINKAKQQKNIKMSYTDNINDLIKAIYRHAK